MIGESTQPTPRPSWRKSRWIAYTLNGAGKHRRPFALKSLARLQSPTLPAKARLKSSPEKPRRARVAPPTPTATSIVLRPPSTSHRAHSRRPLFILSTARRRRAKGGATRGGFYALSTTRKPRAMPRPLKWLLGLSGVFFLFFALTLLTAAAASYGTYEYFAKDLPSIDDIHAIKFETTRIYDRYGHLLYEMYDPNQGKRTYIPIEQMPPALISATIAVEDKSFVQNSGIDPEAIGRALYIDFISKKGQSGASTITQQLVRRVLLPERDEPTLTRKIREAILAVRVTDKYSKDKILEIYLNEIYYGSLSYGVSAAADTYFGKAPRDLTLAQCTLLAGLPQAPGEYDPNHNFELAKARQKIVLGLMVENKVITQQQADAAYAEDVHPRIRTANVPTSAPHFVNYVRQVLEDKYGPEIANRGGLKVFTTIDLNWQAEAQRIAAQQIENIKKQGASNAALVAMNPRTGEILAMVGSVDYTNPIFGEVNVATSLRQPGSSFKPITYATGFQRGDFNPASIVPDLPAKYTNGAGNLPYVPQNYDGRFHGPVPIRNALGNSYNIPAVEMLQALGLPAVLDTAHKMGITTLNDPSRYGLALTLGGGEVTLLDMTSAFSTFANYGYHAPATPFLRIADSSGHILEELDRTHPSGTQALDSGVAYQISDVLSDNGARASAFGPNSVLKIDGINAAVKTGTTNDWKDSWTMGYTPALTVGVWVGNNDGRRMSNVAGAIGAAPIWHNFIKQVYDNPNLKNVLLTPEEKALPDKFIPPAGMVRAQVCAVSGMAPTNACTQLKWEWFTHDNLPTDPCTWHQWVPVTMHDGGATKAGPGVPASDTIERIYTIPPPQYNGWVGGGPPGKTTIITTTIQPDALPTPVAEEPPSVNTYVTPVPATDGSLPNPPSPLEQPGSLAPISGLQLSITSPTSGQAVSGQIAITGHAQADNFAHYTLEYGAGSSPIQMTTIINSQTPPALDQLGSWDTQALPPGPYTLRLTLETTAGEVVRTQVEVSVSTGKPSITIVSPADGSPVYNGEAVTINVAPDGGGAPIAGVEIYADGRRISSLIAQPWSARWAVISGTHELSAIMYTVSGEQARSTPIHITSTGQRPSPTPTRAPILWISNITLYKEISAGINEVWVDVQPNSPIQHVDIYIDGYPSGFATGPGYRVNPSWTPTPTQTVTPFPTSTLDPNTAATATQARVTAEVQATRAARGQATRVARANATSTAKAARTIAAANSANATAIIIAATTSPTPMPPTSTPTSTPTATFVRYKPLQDPMLGDYVARCQFTSGRHRITAIGYDKDNHEIGRNETWVVVK